MQIKVRPIPKTAPFPLGAEFFSNLNRNAEENDASFENRSFYYYIYYIVLTKPPGRHHMTAENVYTLNLLIFKIKHIQIDSSRRLF